MLTKKYPSTTRIVGIVLRSYIPNSGVQKTALDHGNVAVTQTVGRIEEQTVAVSDAVADKKQCFHRMKYLPRACFS